jgi:nucleoside-diphosphate-sugar epimerase
MRTVLVTGGAGFFGSILVKRLLDDGFRCVSVDLQPSPLAHPHLEALRLDVRDAAALEALFARAGFDGVFHCAAIMAHAARDNDYLWQCNVEGTRVLAECARKYRVGRVVFLSSICLWAENFHRPVREDDVPRPADAYGQSKWAGERLLASYAGSFTTAVIRTPTIIDAGRLGLLSILFQFIAEGRRVWVVGGGHNRHQFVSGPDLADACVRAMEHAEGGTFNVGSDDVKPLREVYRYVIDRAGTGARVASLPRGLALPLMRLAYALGVSPLGPYQYRMIAEDFEFDTSRAKQVLGWRPTLSNEEMLLRAYQYYRDNREEIHARTDASAHRRAAKMGAIRLLKWVS